MPRRAEVPTPPPSGQLPGPRAAGPLRRIAEQLEQAALVAPPADAHLLALFAALARDAADMATRRRR